MFRASEPADKHRLNQFPGNFRHKSESASGRKAGAGICLSDNEDRRFTH